MTITRIRPTITTTTAAQSVRVLTAVRSTALASHWSSTVPSVQFVRFRSPMVTSLMQRETREQEHEHDTPPWAPHASELSSIPSADRTKLNRVGDGPRARLHEQQTVQQSKQPTHSGRPGNKSKVDDQPEQHIKFLKPLLYCFPHFLLAVCSCVPASSGAVQPPVYPLARAPGALRLGLAARCQGLKQHATAVQT